MLRSKLTVILLFFVFSFVFVTAIHAQEEQESQEPDTHASLDAQEEQKRKRASKEAGAEFFSWALHGSIFYFAANNGVDSDPAPIIPSGGASFAFQLAKYFKLELTEDIYFTNYEYNSALGYPMACNPENRSAFVMGFITGINSVLFLPIGNSAFRLYGGLAADFRIVALAVGLNHPADFTGKIETDAQLQTDAIKKHFWQKGRWFMPSTGFGFDFPINEKFLIGFDLRSWFPVYKLWTDDNTPKIDGWRFGGGLRITIR